MDSLVCRSSDKPNWKSRNQCLSLAVFHFNVHGFSELCIGIALCLVISKKYKQWHREKYPPEISILIMQTQDNVQLLMKFPSVLTFSNATWQAWHWEEVQHSLGRQHTQPATQQPCQTLGQLLSTVCLLRRTQGIVQGKCLCRWKE